MILSASDVAACCSNASCKSRLSRVTSVSEELAVEPRLVVGLCRLRPFSFDDLLGRALADLLLALASLFIASTRTLRLGIVAGEGSTGYGRPARRRLAPCSTRQLLAAKR